MLNTFKKCLFGLVFAALSFGLLYRVTFFDSIGLGEAPYNGWRFVIRFVITSIGPWIVSPIGWLLLAVGLGFILSAIRDLKEPDKLGGAGEIEAGPDSQIDGELYRVWIEPRLNLPDTMLEESYRFSGRNDLPTITYDILVEMCAMKSAAPKLCIRDFKLSYKINGTIKVLSPPEKDFLATAHIKLEYRLDVDGKEETLSNLADRRLSELQIGTPLEGWLRFTTNEKPGLLENNHAFFITIVDSVGHEHQISKSSGSKRKGQVTYRHISN